MAKTGGTRCQMNRNRVDQIRPHPDEGYALFCAIDRPLIVTLLVKCSGIEKNSRSMPRSSLIAGRGAMVKVSFGQEQQLPQSAIHLSF
jgi:hypothetical protein